MTGRGIDQVLPHPSDPDLHESALSDARDYVRLAEAASGPIARPVGFDYVWGDALEELTRAAPDVRIVNLETSVTRGDAWEDKGINYRMHPDNLGCLTRARLDCCVLANNHVLDYGREGLVETLLTLHRARLKTAGAGNDLAQARAPAALQTASGRVLVLGIGTDSSGIAPAWAATESRPGVNLLEESTREIGLIQDEVARIERPGDVTVASVHWGPNWGFSIPDWETGMAHALVDVAGVDVVHGHSSHHVKGIELYRRKLILYGCGDFLNDYEGIRGYGQYRGDLALMYFATLDAGSGDLQSLRMVPLCIRRFRLERASARDAEWLKGVLDREGASLGTGVDLEPDGALRLRWRPST